MANYAKKFLRSGDPTEDVLHRTKLFHTDSVLCGLSALALKTNAPTVLKKEATLTKSREISYKKQPNFALTFGETEVNDYLKSICANMSAVREWDSNGTVFGYREGKKDFQAGEFGHNDFYPVVVASAFFNSKIDGKTALNSMIL